MGGTFRIAHMVPPTYLDGLKRCHPPFDVRLMDGTLFILGIKRCHPRFLGAVFGGRGEIQRQLGQD